jgi:hypothetical protein
VLRPQLPFNYFSIDARPRARETHPDMGHIDITKKGAHPCPAASPTNHSAASASHAVDGVHVCCMCAGPCQTGQYLLFGAKILSNSQQDTWASSSDPRRVLLQWARCGSRRARRRRRRTSRCPTPTRSATTPSWPPTSSGALPCATPLSIEVFEIARMDEGAECLTARASALCALYADLDHNSRVG